MNTIEYAVQQHFVTFYSPGTLVAETTTKPIDSWNVPVAIEMSKTVLERYNAIPYAFQFITRSRAVDELDSHVTDRSSYYYLGGVVETLEQVRAHNDPKDRILISNMESNNYARIVRSNNPNNWSWCQPLEDNDVVLEITYEVPV